MYPSNVSFGGLNPLDSRKSLSSSSSTLPASITAGLEKPVSAKRNAWATSRKITSLLNASETNRILRPNALLSVS